MNKLNFGSGSENLKGFYNVDILELPNINKSFDFDKFPYPLEDNSFEYIKCKNVLEHCHYPKKVIQEFWRIGKDGCIIEIQVPYVNSRSAFSILDHCSYFNRWSFVYLNAGEGEIEKYETLENKAIPQRFLKYVPMPILKLLGVFLNNIFVEVHAKIKVEKNNEN